MRHLFISFFLVSLLSSCSDNIRIGGRPVSEMEDIRIKEFKTVVFLMDEEGEEYKAHLRCYGKEGYSVRQRKILGEKMDCVVEGIDGKAHVTFPVESFQDLIADMIQNRCV